MCLAIQDNIDPRSSCWAKVTMLREHVYFLSLLGNPSNFTIQISQYLIEVCIFDTTTILILIVLQNSINIPFEQIVIVLIEIDF